MNRREMVNLWAGRPLWIGYPESVDRVLPGLVEPLAIEPLTVFGIPVRVWRSMSFALGSKT